MPRTLPQWKPVVPNACTACTRSQRRAAEARYDALMNRREELEARLVELETWTPGEDIHIPPGSTIASEVEEAEEWLRQCDAAIQALIDTGRLDPLVGGV